MEKLWENIPGAGNLFRKMNLGVGKVFWNFGKRFLASGRFPEVSKMIPWETKWISERQEKNIRCENVFRNGEKDLPILEQETEEIIPNYSLRPSKSILTKIQPNSTKLLRGVF